MKSRVVIGIIALLFIGELAMVQAQDPETLIEGGVSHGGFFGPTLKANDFAGETGVWIGGRGGWLITFPSGNALSFGGGGYGLATDHEVADPNYGEPGSDYFVDIGYGGFILEYVGRSHKLLHYTFTTLIGAGGLSTRDEERRRYQSTLDSFFILEPAATIEVNITSFFRASAGLSYQFVNGFNRAGFSEDDLSGLTGILTLKFGYFSFE